MSDQEASPEILDPFDPENIGVLHFIQLSRIYDVLMGIYSDMKPEHARKLLELHASGGLMNTQPHFTGVFVADEINRD